MSFVRQRLTFLDDETYLQNPRAWYDEGRRSLPREILLKPKDEQAQAVQSTNYPSTCTHWRFDKFSVRSEDRPDVRVVYYRMQHSPE